MEVTQEDCLRIFKAKHGGPHELLSAPGRANIIGEHTDYNQGFVLPFAINKFVHFVGSKSNLDTSSVFAVNLNESVVFDQSTACSGFAKFLQAAIGELQKKYSGSYAVNVVFGGNLPIGAGISSSSALCCGFLVLLSRLYHLDLNSKEILDLAVCAERGAAMEGGIMDQFTIINAKKNQAILLDCLDNSYQYFPLDFKDFSFCIFDSAVAHKLAETSYGERLSTCRNALTKIKDLDSTVVNFRSLNRNHLELLDQVERKRIGHVLSENDRVQNAIEHLKSKQVLALGQLLNQSHESLRTEYEVSCAELDFIAEHLQNDRSCAGARMMGGGFGGSVIALIESSSIKRIGEELSQRYAAQFDLKLDYFEVASTDGLMA